MHKMLVRCRSGSPSEPWFLARKTVSADQICEMWSYSVVLLESMSRYDSSDLILVARSMKYCTFNF